jgi:general secretion pathway protein K
MRKNILRNQLGSEKGVALMLAMFTIVLVSYLATELTYETNVEYLINSNAVSRVKAYYAAKAGIQLSLLRIKIYSNVAASIPQNAKGLLKPDLLDKIWNLPLPWPLPFDMMDKVDKSIAQSAVKDSLMDASYMPNIEDEGSKIDVNDLASPSKAIQDLTKKRLLEIFEEKKRTDQEWSQAHSDLRPEEIVNNLQDWVTPGRSSQNGGDKLSKYSGLNEFYPPNRSFRSNEELHMVAGMTDDIYALLEPQVTVYGASGMNPNHASKELFMSLDPSITSAIADLLISRRDPLSQKGPYTSADDFWSSVSGLGATVDPNLQKSLPIITDQTYNFKITSVGSWKTTSRKITVYVFDVKKTAAQLAQSISQMNGIQPAAGANNTPQPSLSSSKGPPRIVYWNER